MKVCKWLVLFSFVGTTCFAQSKIDSLKKLSEVARDKDQTDREASFLSLVGWEYYALNNSDSALKYFHKALKVGKDVHDPRFFGSVYNNLAIMNYTRGFQDSSIYYYNEALNHYENAGDTLNAINVEINLAILYDELGLYEKSLAGAFHALKKLEVREPDRTLSSCYNTIGSVYSKIGEYDNSLKYYRLALGVRKKIGYEKGIGQSYNNIGDVYSSLHQYNSALANLTRAMKLKRKLGDKAGLFTVINNLGEISITLGRNNDALNYFKESLALSKEVKNIGGEIAALNNLGLLYLTIKDYKKALTFLNQSDELINKGGLLEQRKINLSLKERLYKETGDFRQAFNIAEQLALVTDSLLNEEKAESLILIQTKYETEKKEQQIALLKQEQNLQAIELRTNKIWILSLIIGSILLVTVVILVYYLYRTSQQNKQKVELLMRELHHRVKNNLQILSSLFLFQSQQLKDKAAIEAIKSSEGSVNAMALIHKKLYGNDQIKSINMKEYVTDLVGYLVSTYGYATRPFHLNLSIEEVRFPVDQAVTTGLIINELVSNALKYAYEDQEKPELSVQLIFGKNQDFAIIIKDNGKGIIDENQMSHSTSFGLSLVKMLLKELRGKMTIQSENGTGFIINIPIPTV